jgi:NADH-ubiquinone oxidoreductase-F iron-sulfur binding region
MLHVAWERPGADLLRWISDLMALVSGRGACHLPDGTAGLVDSTLTVFEADLRWHAERGPCGRAVGPPVLPLPPALPAPTGDPA